MNVKLVLLDINYQQNLLVLQYALQEVITILQEKFS